MLSLIKRREVRLKKPKVQVGLRGCSEDDIINFYGKKYTAKELVDALREVLNENPRLNKTEESPK